MVEGAGVGLERSIDYTQLTGSKGIAKLTKRENQGFHTGNPHTEFLTFIKPMAHLNYARPFPNAMDTMNRQRRIDGNLKEVWQPSL
jgi:hypothetical protein